MFTFDELTRKGVSHSAPPVMVSNVAYGRTIYVKLETTSKSKDVQAAFKALLKDNSVETSGQYKDIFEESTFTAVVFIFLMAVSMFLMIAFPIIKSP